MDDASFEKEMESFDQIYDQILQMRMNGGNLPEETRRQRAEALCMQMFQMCDDDD